MDGILNWVGNILFFLVMITVAENLLPGKNYSRYIRLSAGMVLILLVLKPVTAGFHLEEQIARSLETFTFQQEAKDLSREILGIERQRMDQVIDSYQQAVEADVSAMAEDMGFVPVLVKVVIDRVQESTTWGSVVGIQMEVKKKGEEQEEDSRAVQAVNPVEPVTVTLTETAAESREQETETEEFEQLRRKVENYYGLETGEVEITYKRQ